MRKILLILLAIMLVLCLAGCRGRDVKAAEQAIADIGEVSAESGEKIAAAQEAFSLLKEKDREKVSNAADLEHAEKAFMVAKVEAAISALNDIGSGTRAKLEGALEAYYRLDPGLRSQVSNSGLLDDTREILAVTEAIDAIGSIDPEADERIARAQARFDLLDPGLQDKVPNHERLEDAKAVFEVVKAIELIPTAPPYVKEDVVHAQELYEALDPELRITVGNYETLQAAREYGDLMDLKDEELNSGVYLRACEHQDRFEMEEALNYFKQLPEDYRDTASRIAAVEGYLVWYAAREEVQGKWVWDGQPAEASDGTKYPADYKSLTISETDDPGEYEEVSFREKRLFYAEIKTEKPDTKQLPETVLFPLPDLRKDSFTASNCTNSYNNLSITCEARNSSKLTLYCSSNAKTGVWDQLLSVHIYLQEDGRLRMECYVTVFEGEAAANATPMFNQHLIFYYDKAE